MAQLGRPRLPEGEGKVETIRALFTKKEARWIAILAKREGMSISGWCRNVIQDELLRAHLADEKAKKTA